MGIRVLEVCDHAGEKQEISKPCGKEGNKDLFLDSIMMNPGPSDSYAHPRNTAGSHFRDLTCLPPTQDRILTVLESVAVVTQDTRGVWAAALRNGQAVEEE